MMTSLLCDEASEFRGRVDRQLGRFGDPDSDIDDATAVCDSSMSARQPDEQGPTTSTGQSLVLDIRRAAQQQTLTLPT